MAGTVIHQGGSYVSSQNGGKEVEAWQTTSDGVKTYTAGPRAGQTEYVGTSSQMSANQSGTPQDTSDNTILYALLAVLGVGAVYLFTNKRNVKSKKRK